MLECWYVVCGNIGRAAHIYLTFVFPACAECLAGKLQIRLTISEVANVIFFKETAVSPEISGYRPLEIVVA